jgi:hypothetical protein
MCLKRYFISDNPNIFHALSVTNTLSTVFTRACSLVCLCCF